MRRLKHLGATGRGSWRRPGGYAIILLLIICLLLPSLATAQSEIKLKAGEKKQLDTFFSNFSEANLKSFEQNSLPPEALLDFALNHIYKNAFKSLKRSKDGAAAIIPAVLVDQTTEKYFGQKLPKHEKAEYLVPLADGEAYTFSQISRLLGAGQGLFQAEGVIYLTGSGGTPDPHGNPAAWKKAGEEVEQIGKFSALIKKEKTGKERYLLLEYNVTMNNP
jgi:hypothetical protein